LIIKYVRRAHATYGLYHILRILRDTCEPCIYFLILLCIFVHDQCKPLRCVCHVLFSQKLSETISPNQPFCIYVLSPPQSEDFWRNSRRITYCSVQTRYWVMTSKQTMKQLLLLGNRFLISKYTKPLLSNAFANKHVPTETIGVQQ
jgi:hypothetical protein